MTLAHSVSDILARALAGYTEDYKHHSADGRTYIQWGKVEQDMHAIITKWETMPEYTTTEAAEILKTDRRNIQNYAKRHNLPKFGREYIIKESDFEGMRSELGKPGAKKKVSVP